MQSNYPETASKGLMPRLTPLLRLAFALAAIFPLVPLVFVLAMYGLAPGVDYAGPPPSSATLTVGIAAGLFFFAFVGLAVTGWNPLHRFDVALANARTEAAAVPADAPKPALWKRIGFVVLLLGGAYVLNWLVLGALSRVIEAMSR